MVALTLIASQVVSRDLTVVNKRDGSAIWSRDINLGAGEKHAHIKIAIECICLFFWYSYMVRERD